MITMTSQLRDELLVPEGDLPPGVAPQPGPRPGRDIWAGSTAEAPQPTSPTQAARRRLTGLDAARGFALVGMIAVHTLPYQEQLTGMPSLAWSLFAGRSAALFALLTGVTLALMTGRDKPHTGARWRSSAVSLLIRAAVIFSLGLGLNHLDLPVYNILPYYGLLFLLAIPFTRLGAARSFLAAAVIAVAGPVMLHLINSGVSYEVLPLPTFTDLAYAPTDTLLSLLSGGTYPAITWLAFLLVGMGLGRLRLADLGVQIHLMVTGAALAVAAPVISGLLLGQAGGWRRLAAAVDGTGLETALSIDRFGPEDGEPLPTSSWWWLAVDGPHTNTPLSILAGVGFGLLMVGVFLIITTVAEQALTPLIAAGSMTLTFYTAHLVTMSLIDTSAQPTLWFLLQIGAAGFLATCWYVTAGRGPLERIVSFLAKLPARTPAPVSKEEAAKHRLG